VYLLPLSDLFRENLRRGELLLERRRFEDALSYFTAAMACGDGYALSMMAICQANIESEKERSLETINAAIGADPDEPDYLRLKAIILCRLNRPKDGLEVARAGVRMDHADPNLHSAEAQALLNLDRWEEAEASARVALAIDPDHTEAENQLVHALYEQRKGGTNQEVVLRQLSQRPEEPHAHYNAGYSFLESGDWRRAMQHFEECLRLDPNFDPARTGMLEAMRGRYAIYRRCLRTYFAADARAKNLKASELMFPLSIPMLVVAALAHAIASFFLLFDRRARMAMGLDDKIYGVFGGGGFLLGAGLILLGLVIGVAFLWKLGLTLLFTTLFIGVQLDGEIPDRLRM